MLAVSPPADTSNFEQFYDDYKGEMATTQEPILDGGWDEPVIVSPSSLPSTSASGSSSPAQNGYLGTSTSLGLLIRSKYQGWERSFELHHDWPIPRITKSDEVLIRNVSIGLNPVDFKRYVKRESSTEGTEVCSLLNLPSTLLVYCTILAYRAHLGYWAETLQEW